MSVLPRPGDSHCPNSPENSELVFCVKSRVMFAIPRSQNALVAAGQGHVAPGLAIVRTVAVAINPVDAKMLDYCPAYAWMRLRRGRWRTRVRRPASSFHRRRGCWGRSWEQLPGVPCRCLCTVCWSDLSCCSRFLTRGGIHSWHRLGHRGSCLFPRIRDSPSIKDPIDRAGPESDVTPNAAWVLVSGGSSATGTRAIQLLKV